MNTYFDNPENIRDYEDRIQLEMVSSDVYSSSNFIRPLSDDDLNQMDRDLAHRIEATTEHTAIASYKLGFDAGERKGEDDQDKYTRQNINNNLTDLIFNIVNGDKEAALSNLADICLDCGVYNEYKENLEKAEEVTKVA